MNLHLQLHLVFHISFFISMMKVTAGYYHTHYKG
nr:MAG TPA: hypothetical protein [Caudoviricetes sp.]